MSIQLLHEMRAEVTVLRKKVRKYDQIMRQLADNFNPVTKKPFTLDEIVRLAQRIVTDK